MKKQKITNAIPEIDVPLIKGEEKLIATATPIPDNVEIVNHEATAFQNGEEKAYKASEMLHTSVEGLAAKFEDFKEAPKIPTIEEVKAKRGRKPGGKNAPKVPIEDFKPKIEQPVFAGAVISGLILLTIVDAFLPWIISFVHNKANPHNRMTAKELQLPADMKKDLAGVADEYIKTSNVKMTPGQALLLSVVAAYGTAYMAATTKKPAKTSVQSYTPPPNYSPAANRNPIIKP